MTAAGSRLLGCAPGEGPADGAAPASYSRANPVICGVSGPQTGHAAPPCKYGRRRAGHGSPTGPPETGSSVKGTREAGESQKSAPRAVHEMRLPGQEGRSPARLVLFQAVEQPWCADGQHWEGLGAAMRRAAQRCRADPSVGAQAGDAGQSADRTVTGLRQGLHAASRSRPHAREPLVVAELPAGQLETRRAYSRNASSQRDQRQRGPFWHAVAGGGTC